MRSKAIWMSTAIMLLGACSDGGTVADPSDPEAIAAAAAQLPKAQPGEYKVTGELVEFTVPGMSAEEAQMMRGMFEAGATQERTMCISQAEAEAGFEEFLDKMAQGGEQCQFSEFTTSGDTIDATLSCDDGAGNTGTIAFAGTVSETSQDMTLTMDMSGAGAGQSMHMVLRNRSERVGECPAQ